MLLSAPNVMSDLNYYSVRDKAIELGIIKVSEKDGSHSFNASPDKLYALVLSFAEKTQSSPNI